MSNLISKSKLFMLTAEEQLQLDKINEQRKTENLDPLTELPPVPTEPSDEAIFSALSKKLGKPVSSYEELISKPQPTEADIQKEKEKRETNKTVWALQNNKIQEKKLKEFYKESEAPENLVFENFAKNKRVTEPNLTDDELKEDFEAVKKQFGEDEIKAYGETLLKQKYSDVFNLENEYSDFEESEKNNQSFKKKLETESPAFIAANNELLDKYSTDGFEIEVPLEEGQEPIKFLYKANKTITDKLKAAYSTEDKLTDAVKNGWDKEKQSFLIKASLINLDVTGLAKQIYEQTTLNREALLRGIPPVNKTGKTEIATPADEERLEANKKLAKEYFKQPL